MTSFVILHYQNIEVTHNCINYLKKLSGDIAIVIVDNCSPNGTGIVLKNEYIADDNITVILNRTNSGFAEGNNVGYFYAKNKLSSEIIVVMNSDVYIYDTDFNKKLVNQYDRCKNVEILAPDIITANNQHQNPYLFKPISTQKQKRIIIKKTIGRLFYSIPFINEFVLQRKYKKQNFRVRNKIQEEKRNILPHGACVIFLPGWIGKEEFCFLKGTFLFCEEEILFDYAKFKGYTIKYTPDLEVHHLEDASQNFVQKNLTSKKKQQLKCEIASRKKLLEYRSKWEMKK